MLSEGRLSTSAPGARARAVGARPAGGSRTAPDGLSFSSLHDNPLSVGFTSLAKGISYFIRKRFIIEGLNPSFAQTNFPQNEYLDTPVSNSKIKHKVISVPLH